jgi:F420-dependent oxidoreductase-like protein
VRARVFIEPQQGASYETQLEMARLAERCGFDAFFRSDHFLSLGGRGLPGPTDSWVTLGALARETTTIRLGTMVTSATFRWPGPLAIAVAQVDAMSGGRVELGLGTGWYEAEHAAYGVPFFDRNERFERLEEQLAIVTGLWGTPAGERFAYQGRHYQLTDCPALPKPIQAPGPPVIVGGGGPRRTPDLAARFADEYNLGFSGPGVAGPQFDRVREACVAVGRDPATLGLSVALTVCCGTDEAEVERRAGWLRREVADLRSNGLAGTPDEVVARCAEFAALGADTLYFQVLNLADHDHVRLLGEEVLPRIR